MADESPKEVAYYSALVQAWITTKLDQDKTIITISCAGIGLIITLLTTVPIQGAIVICLYILSIAGFCAAIVSATTVLGKNSAYLEKVIKGDRRRDPYLRYWDMTKTVGFYAGLFFLIVIGLIAGFDNLGKKEGARMDTDRIEKNVTFMEKSIGGPDECNKSLNGIGEIAPSTSGSSGSSGETTNTNQNTNKEPPEK